jgi:site-specific recombinase XerD
MLERYFKYPKVLRRLRSGVLGDEMDRIAAHLSEVGYTHGSAKLYISRLGRFNQFVTLKSRTSTIDQNVIDRFVRGLPNAAARLSSGTAIKHARRVAPKRFITTCRMRTDPNAQLLAAYANHLRHVRGLQPKSSEGLLLGARRILAWHRDHLPDQPFAAITGENVLALVQYLLSQSANQGTQSKTTTSVRTFLRFLRWSDLAQQDLARFVPRTPCWRLVHVPPRLAWADVKRAIATIDVATPSGVRDRSLLLLLATTGLRSKELRSLELRDIYWRAAEVVVRRTKARRGRIVPLLHEAGAALAKYVLHARPNVANPRVFLTCVPPVRPFATSSAISRIVRHRLEQSGLKLPGPTGAHLLRHSLATELVRRQLPINEVADLLGHQSIDTTAIYVKVALPQLANVSLPFPGAAS